MSARRYQESGQVNGLKAGRVPDWRPFGKPGRNRNTDCGFENRIGGEVLVFRSFALPELKRVQNIGGDADGDSLGSLPNGVACEVREVRGRLDPAVTGDTHAGDHAHIVLVAYQGCIDQSTTSSWRPENPARYADIRRAVRAGIAARWNRNPKRK